MLSALSFGDSEPEGLVVNNIQSQLMMRRQLEAETRQIEMRDLRQRQKEAQRREAERRKESANKKAKGKQTKVLIKFKRIGLSNPCV